MAEPRKPKVGDVVEITLRWRWVDAKVTNVYTDGRIEADASGVLCARGPDFWRFPRSVDGHEHALAAARERVIEAAKAWGASPLSRSTMTTFRVATPEASALQDAVAALEKLEAE